MTVLPDPLSHRAAARAAIEVRLALAQSACMRLRLSPGCTEQYLEASCDVESLERQLTLLMVPAPVPFAAG